MEQSKGNRVRVKILTESIAGAGDPSPAELARKYDRMRRQMQENTKALQAIGKPGRTPEEIERLIQLEMANDAKIPRLSGHTGSYAYKRGDEVMIDAGLAEKWEALNICTILQSEKAKAA